MRYIFAALTVLASPAVAHDGFHHHPHGIDYGWIIAAAVGVVGGLIVARVRK